MRKWVVEGALAAIQFFLSGQCQPVGFFQFSIFAGFVQHFPINQHHEHKSDHDGDRQASHEQWKLPPPPILIVQVVHGQPRYCGAHNAYLQDQLDSGDSVGPQPPRVPLQQPGEPEFDSLDRVDAGQVEVVHIEDIVGGIGVDPFQAFANDDERKLVHIDDERSQ